MTARWIAFIALIILGIAIMVDVDEGFPRGVRRVGYGISIAAFTFVFRLVGKLDDERHFWYKCFSNTTIKDGVRRCVVK
jgi:hypothetical protein